MALAKYKLDQTLPAAHGAKGKKKTERKAGKESRLPIAQIILPVFVVFAPVFYSINIIIWF